MVQSLVEEQEPQKASETIVELSKLIRNFFESSTSNYGQRNETKLKEISLEREYELLDQYLKFEQMKHPDKFDFGITYDSNIHLGYDEIPPLFLQPYVENAVLHGALKRNDGAKAFILVHFSKIEAEDETNDDIIICTIEDNGIGIEQSKSLKAQKTGKQSNSIGMALLAKRKDKLNELDYDIQVNCEKADPYDSAYPGTKITVRIGYKYND
jgi:sensor histidine kinase YesM